VLLSGALLHCILVHFWFALDNNSINFYSQSWEVDIKTTREWKKEFDDEIVSFDTMKK
jgi:hypothetical protein